MKTLYTVITLLLHIINTQGKTLPENGYEALEALIEKNCGTDNVWPLLNAYRDKARRTGNWEQLCNAYHYAIFESTGTDRLIYADSMILAAEHTTDHDLIGGAYLTKGIVYYFMKDHLRAMDNYAIANSHIAIANDPYLVHKVKYHMALIKSYLGYYNEAIALLKQCESYYSGEDRFALVNTLHSLALCYTRNGNQRQSILATKRAREIASEIGYKEITASLKQLEGINCFHASDYTGAIRNLQSALKGLRENKDFATESIAYFYLGKSYKALHQMDRALPYFKKVDSIFVKKEYIQPELRENYELIIAYYRSKRDINAAIPYIERLMALDKELESNFKYLSQKIHREYDTRQLEQFKREAAAKLEKGDRNTIIFSLVVLLVVVLTGGIVIRQSVVKKRQQRQYEATIARLNAQGGSHLKPKGKSQVAGDAITQMIIKCLEDFETGFGFTQRELTVKVLADQFGTNEKYLSATINKLRQQSFTEYINTLRIAYITERLRKEPRLRRFNTLSLAEEAGFVSSAHFSKHFKKANGLTPALFVQKLEEKKNSGTEETDQS